METKIIPSRIRIYDKFDSSYTVLENGCWEWYCNLTAAEYPQIYLRNGASEKAHRFSYIIYKGDPTDFDVHHKCKNKLCVNPYHLELKTNSDHLSLRKKTHCKYGHRLTFYGSHIRCKICHNQYSREANANRRIRLATSK